MDEKFEILKSPDDWVVGRFVNFPGLVTQGKSEEEVQTRLAELWEESQENLQIFRAGGGGVSVPHDEDICALLVELICGQIGIPLPEEMEQ